MTITKSAKRRLLLEIAGLVAGALLVAAGSWYLMNLKCDTNAFFCGNSDVLEYPSPGQEPPKKKVALFFRSCGATTPYETHGSILAFGERLPNARGNAFIARGAHGPGVKTDAAVDLTVVWVGDDEVKITYRKGIHMRDERKLANGVRISYEQIKE